LTKVIRARPHIQDPCLDRQAKTIVNQFAPDPWVQFATPTVQIHIEMHTAKLLVIRSVFASWLNRI
jgi:hypothetical protein